MREEEIRSRKFAKAFRGKLTEAETIVWSRLRLRKRHGVHFRRQHPIGPYIADFACVSARLVIEVDGATHGSESEVAHDLRRDAFMRKRGWRVMRVSNQAVYRDLDDVIEAVFAQIPPPSATARAVASTSPVNGGGKL
jgi:very-short-patch-repair endonuclease